MVRFRFSITAAFLLSAAAVAGCAHPTASGSSGQGYNRAVYAMALNAAALDGLTRHVTGKGFYAHLGEGVHGLAAAQPCDGASLHALLTDKTRGCHLFQPPPRDRCGGDRACVSLGYDPDLFVDPDIRRAVLTALERPCDILTPPDEAPRPQYGTFAGLSAEANWRVLECDGAMIQATSVDVDERNRVVTVYFDRSKN